MDVVKGVRAKGPWLGAVLDFATQVSWRLERSLSLTISGWAGPKTVELETDQSQLLRLQKTHRQSR